MGPSMGRFAEPVYVTYVTRPMLLQSILLIYRTILLDIAIGL